MKKEVRKLPSNLLIKRMLIYVLLCLPQLAISQDGSHAVVYDGKQDIGRLNDIASRTCTNCYTIRKIDIFKTEVQLILPVSIVSTNGRGRFTEDHSIQERLVNNEKILTVQSNYTSEKIEFVFSAKNGGKLLLVQKTANASYHYQIARDDYADFPSTQICRRDFFKTERNIPARLDFRNFDMLKKSDCFHCPVNLSVQECIRMKNSKTPFKWK